MVLEIALGIVLGYVLIKLLPAILGVALLGLMAALAIGALIAAYLAGEVIFSNFLEIIVLICSVAGIVLVSAVLGVAYQFVPVLKKIGASDRKPLSEYMGRNKAEQVGRYLLDRVAVGFFGSVIFALGGLLIWTLVVDSTLK